MQRAITTMAPDGGNAEGPGYWNYATQYTAYYLAACQSALGTDFGLTSMPGFAETAWFRIHTTGPTGKTFNYADAGEWAGQAPQMFWMARLLDEPTFAVNEREFANKWGEIFHLLWFEGRGESMKASNAPLDAMFRGVNVTCFRSAWDDPDAFYVGFKGGDNKANHSHLDLGTFVLDAFGQRWAVDLGPDDYNLPKYFGANRFTYYRLKTEGHNTLTIGGANQDPKAEAPLLGYLSTPERAMAVADLTGAYVGAAKIRRGIELVNRNALIVQDEIELRETSGEIAWNMHTLAKVQIDPDGTSAVLSLGGRRLAARVLEPAGAKFELKAIEIPAPQRRMKGLSNLSLTIPDKASSARIVTVLASPDVAKAVTAPAALDQWIKDGPIKAGNK
jgi:hypothetical protein